jgi:hypothetical protein
MKLTLPNNNMTSGRKTTCKDDKGIVSEQLFVIPNNENNRNAIKKMNKLARQQGSKYRFQGRYRLPKEGAKYGEFGKLSSENAKGIGLYVIGAQNNSACGYYTPSYIKKVVKENQNLKKEINNHTRINKDKISKDHKTVLNKLALVYDENQNLIKENNRLKKLLKFQTLTFEQKAIYIIEKEIGKWQDNGWDENYFFNDVDQECVSIEINTILNNLKNDYGMK